MRQVVPVLSLCASRCVLLLISTTPNELARHASLTLCRERPVSYGGCARQRASVVVGGLVVGMYVCAVHGMCGTSFFLRGLMLESSGAGII